MFFNGKTMAAMAMALALTGASAWAEGARTTGQMSEIQCAQIADSGSTVAAATAKKADDSKDTESRDGK